MDETKPKLTLDQAATYRIKVPGKLDEIWLDLAGAMAITYDSDEAGRPVSILTGAIDQAALLGLLRRLYSLGLPLISVVCLDCES